MTNGNYRRLAFALCLTSLAAAGGCSPVAEPGDTQGTGDEEPEYGESTSDELVAEGQLNGRSLGPKELVLTYDDGPGARTAELAEYLNARGVRATFFINGMRVPGRQAQVDAVVGGGHLLANHTQHHWQLTSLSAETIRSEVELTDAIVREAQPEGPWLLRAPFGAWSVAVANAVNASTPLQAYVGSIFWDMGGATTATSAADWDCWGAKKYSVERCAALYLTEIRQRGRGIVLMHDLHNKTVDMSKILVPALQAEGFVFKRLDEVPAVREALEQGPPGSACHSATLGHYVAEKTCVQASSNHHWYICDGGEWYGIAAPTAACETQFPLGG